MNISRLRLLIVSGVSALLGFAVTFFYWDLGVVLGRTVFVTVIDALPVYMLFVAIPSIILRKRQPPVKVLTFAEKTCGALALAFLFFIAGVLIGVWINLKILNGRVGQ